MEKEKSLSKVLGILSICCGILFALGGLILGIIGLYLKKTPLDKKLNIWGIVISVLNWLVTLLYLS